MTVLKLFSTNFLGREHYLISEILELFKLNNAPCALLAWIERAELPHFGPRVYLMGSLLIALVRGSSVCGPSVVHL